MEWPRKNNKREDNRREQLVTVTVSLCFSCTPCALAYSVWLCFVLLALRWVWLCCVATIYSVEECTIECFQLQFHDFVDCILLPFQEFSWICGPSADDHCTAPRFLVSEHAPLLQHTHYRTRLHSPHPTHPDTAHLKITKLT